MKIPALIALSVFGASSVFASYSTDFSGAAPWDFDSETDPNNQLGGTDQLVYTGASSNQAAYVETAVSPNYFGEEGTYYSSFSLDLSNYVTGTSDFSTSNLYTIGTVQGNKGAFDSQGSILNFGVAGFNNPGEIRFGVSGAVVWNNAGNGNTNLFTPGTSPSFPLEYEVVIGTTLEKDGTEWTVTHDLWVTGPSAGGDIITHQAQSMGTVDRDSFMGWLDVDTIQLGYSPSGSTPFGDGNSIAIDNFSMVPEPSAYALIFGALALGGVIWRKRR